MKTRKIITRTINIKRISNEEVLIANAIIKLIITTILMIIIMVIINEY